MTVAKERLVYFPCGTLNLAGILTLSGFPSARTVLIPWGAGTSPSSGPNRIRARLARSLANQGFHAFRFDYRGVGESDGEYRRPDMGNANTDDILSACAWLESQGLSRIIVVANCFGGWSSLMAAPMISGLEGLAVINAPVRRDHIQVKAGRQSLGWWVAKLKQLRLNKLRNPERRALYRKLLIAKASAYGRPARDSRFRKAIESIRERQIPLLLLYGDDDFLADLEAELDRGLSAALEQATWPTRVVKVAERLEGYATLEAQRILEKEVGEWISDLS